MRRIALFLLPIFVLTACERGVPTAAEIDGLDAPAFAVTLDDGLASINLYAVSTMTIQVVIPSVSTVPTTASLTNEHNGAEALPIHEFNAGCTMHFQDVVGEDGELDLILHFDAATLFGSYGTAAPVDPITLTLDVDWVDAEGNLTEYDKTYSVQLGYTVPSGYRGGR